RIATLVSRSTAVPASPGSRIESEPGLRTTARSSHPHCLVLMPHRAFGIADARRQHESVQAERLADGPGLERTASRLVRRVAIRDFGEVPESGPLQFAQERLEEPIPRLALSGDRPA